jgi:cytoskeletal protein CcmA (bactofilin family)
MAKNRNIELSTIIGKDSKIQGNLQIKGGIRIDGEIDGKIESDGFVTVGLSGKVKSDIVANECLVSGVVEGNVVVKEALELDKNAHLSGNITAKILKIHTGAIFTGNCKMSKNQKSPIVQKKEDILPDDIQKNT